jgi:hypothetical protein
MYQYKFNKYKYKYFNLLNQNGGNEIYLLIRNTASLENLKKVGAGVPHAVYLDPIINSIVKFRKRERNPDATLYNREPRKYFITESMKSNHKIINFKIKLDNYKGYFLDPEITELEKHKEVITKVIDINKVISDLSSFLQITGYVIYPNIVNDYNRNIFLGSIYYQYYPSINNTISININNKDNFLKVINEFKILNQRGYLHGDLQNNCRNIVSINENEFKVIDIDSISKIFNNDFVFISDLDNSFKDIKDLIKCLTYQKVHIDIKKYESIIENLIDKLYKHLFVSQKFYEIIDIREPPWVRYQAKNPKLYTDVKINKSKWATINLYVWEHIKDIITVLYIELIKDFQKFFEKELLAKKINIHNIEHFIGKKLILNTEQIIKLKIKEDGYSNVPEFKDYHFELKLLPEDNYEIIINKK